jgi:hypothetical protein
MSRKHFNAAARFIREHFTGTEHAAAIELLCHLGRTFNPRFDAERFRRAAGDDRQPTRQPRRRAA